MEISFSSSKLAKRLSDKKEIQKHYGELSKKIQIRLSVLENAFTLDDVPKIKPDRCHQLKNDRKGQFAVDVSGNYRIIFQPNHDPIPLDENGSIDLKKITKILIVSANEDYH